MKKIFKFLFAILFLATSLPTAAKGKLTTISGTIKGYKGEETYFIKNMYDEKDEGLTLKVAKNGTFKATFELEKRSFDAALNIGNYMYMLYIQPGGNYIAKVDITTEEDETKYTIEGSNAKENLLVKNYILKLQRAYLFWDKLNAFDTFKDYNNYVDTISGSLMSELKATNNTEFISIMSQRIEQDKTYLKFTYGFNALQKEAKKNGTIEKIQPDADYENLLASAEWKSINEKIFLRFKDPFIMSVAFTCPDVNIVDVLKNLKKALPTQNAVNQFATAVLANFFSRGGNGTIDEVYDYYKTICTDAESLKAMEQAKTFAKAVEKGSPAPEFEMKDSKGKVFHVADFKGKALFIDVWATWCGPCKAEIPFFKKLVEKYKGDNRIEFISVSIDANKKAWDKMIATQAHEWKQLIVDNDMNSDLCKKYQINSIPRFMLFDKEGKIVTVTAPYPSDESIIEIINKAL